MFKNKAVAISLLLLSTQARATGAVAGATEITQILNNAQLMMQMTEAQQQTVTQLQNLYLVYDTAKREIEHMKQIGEEVAGMSEKARMAELNRLADVIFRTERVNGNLDDLSHKLESRMQEAYQSDKTMQEYVVSQGEAIARNEKRAITRVEEEKAMISALQEDSAAIQKLSRQITSTAGTQQSLGLMNTQLNQALVSLQRLTAVVQAGQDNAAKANAEADEVLRAKSAEKFLQHRNAQGVDIESEALREFDPKNANRLSDKKL